ncbi:MAG: uroporphyrinogen-III synthase [Bacteroidota bacterium]|nr:uroporphyrinogen-III synthase [Bacteroidota bacterium]
MKIKTILISQPEPENLRSPFFDLADKYNVKISFRKFIQVEEIPAIEFLKERINILDHSSVIITSRTSIENFFRICEETRVDVPPSMKFFCPSESYALYLQKYTTYRKRKIFFPKRRNQSMKDVIMKHKKDNFFIPCSNISSNEIPSFLSKNNLKYSTATLYKTVSSDLSDLDINEFDVVAFFSPAGIISLQENFNGFKQNDIKIAAFGNNTKSALEDIGLSVDIEAPTPQAPSMKMALEQFIKSNK